MLAARIRLTPKRPGTTMETGKNDRRTNGHMISLHVTMRPQNQLHYIQRSSTRTKQRMSKRSWNTGNGARNSYRMLLKSWVDKIAGVLVLQTDDSQLLRLSIGYGRREGLEQ